MQQYLDLAQHLAKEAAKIMLHNFGLNLEREWKEDNTPLTIADTTINELVIREVKKHFPEHGVLGEEASFGSEREYLWVVDPVDGTMPYSNGIPTSVFSLALVHHGEPIVAVVQDPFCLRMYYATKGGGSFMNGQPLKVNTQAEFGPQVFIEAAAKYEFNGFRLLPIRESFPEGSTSFAQL